jgi:glucose/arabinose dehydrogenase
MILAPALEAIFGMQFFKRALLLVFLPLALALHCNKSEKQSSTPPPGPVTIKDSVLVSGLGYPWEILWGPDDFIWMTERDGRISRVNPNTGTVTPLLTISEVVSSGEGGLLGMVLHPQFSTNPFVYVIYNYNGSGYEEKLVRYRFNGTTLTTPQILLDHIDAASIHNGSRLIIVNDKLFISTGDAANSAQAQNNSSLNGKILRLNLDGSIPSDNPIPGNPLWSTGHRNAQGMVHANNRLYISEHGPSSDDEVNIVQKGRNYGWPDVRGFCDESSEQSFCSANSVVEPLKAWTPTIAVCGLDYYDKDAIPQWKGSLLMATLKDARLYQLKLNSSYNGISDVYEYFANEYGRLRDLCISPSGKVYLCTSNGGGNDKIVVVSGQ